MIRLELWAFWWLCCWNIWNLSHGTKAITEAVAACCSSFRSCVVWTFPYCKLNWELWTPGNLRKKVKTFWSNEAGQPNCRGPGCWMMNSNDIFCIWDSNEGRRLTEFLDRSTRGLVRISEGWGVSQYQEPMERWLASEDRCYATLCNSMVSFASDKCQVCMQIYGLKHAQTLDSIDHQQDIWRCCSFVQEFTCRCMQLLLAARSLKMLMLLWASSESVRAQWLLGPGPPSTRTTWSTTDAYIRVHQKPRVWNAMTGIYLLL